MAESVFVLCPARAAGAARALVDEVLALSRLLRGGRVAGTFLLAPRSAALFLRAYPDARAPLAAAVQDGRVRLFAAADGALPEGEEAMLSSLAEAADLAASLGQTDGDLFFAPGGPVCSELPQIAGQMGAGRLFFPTLCRAGAPLPAAFLFRAPDGSALPAACPTTETADGMTVYRYRTPDGDLPAAEEPLFSSADGGAAFSDALLCAEPTAPFPPSSGALPPSEAAAALAARLALDGAPDAPLFAVLLREAEAGRLSAAEYAASVGEMLSAAVPFVPGTADGTAAKREAAPERLLLVFNPAGESARRVLFLPFSGGGDKPVVVRDGARRPARFLSPDEGDAPAGARFVAFDSGDIPPLSLALFRVTAESGTDAPAAPDIGTEDAEKGGPGRTVMENATFRCEAKKGRLLITHKPSGRVLSDPFFFEDEGDRAGGGGEFRPAAEGSLLFFPVFDDAVQGAAPVASLCGRFRTDLPADYDRAADERTAATCPAEGRLTLSLRGEEPFLFVDCRVRERAGHHRLRLCLRGDGSGFSAFCARPFDRAEPAGESFTAGCGVLLARAGGSLVCLPGTPLGGTWRNDTLFLTLLRAAAPADAPRVTRRTLCVGMGDGDPVAFLRAARARALPPFGALMPPDTAVSRHTPPLFSENSPSGSVTWTGDGVLLSAARPARAGDGAALRFTAPGPSGGVLHLRAPGCRLSLSTIAEEERLPLESADIAIRMAPGQILTLCAARTEEN